VNIVRLELTRHAGQMTAPAGSARHTWREREGLLLRVEDTAGRSGFGEASPLPGYSPDTLDACERALADVDPASLGAPDALGERLRDLPAARHALETALWDLAARRAGQPIWALLAREAGPAAAPSLLPLAVVLDDPALDIERARSAAAGGVRTLKLKLGRTPFADELEAARALRRELGRAIELRFDVNGAWSLADARSHLRELASVRPELVEESVPLADLVELVDPGVPLALDESLQHTASASALDAVVARCPIAALVLKPMTLGGFSRCLELARWARSRGVDVIVSHVYDGPVALAAAAHLALAVGSPIRAAGLAPHAGLGAWPALDVPLVRAAHVIADDGPGLGVRAERLAA
jgi:o-succinylbenzoate synthase